MKTILKNWKTTALGIALAVAAFLKAKHVIDSDTLTLVISVLGALGFVVAKDGDQSGLAK